MSVAIIIISLLLIALLGKKTLAAVSSSLGPRTIFI